MMFDLELDSMDELPVPRLNSELQKWADMSIGGRAQAQLWVHAIQAKEKSLVEGAGAGAPHSPHVDVRRFAQELADLGNTVWLRNGVFAPPPESGISQIRHTFVVVSLPGTQPSHQPVYVVVDPQYKQHFELAGQGAEGDRYRQMLQLLPSVFVGTAEQLSSLVSNLCKEMEKVFQSRGVTLPPWRHPHVMQGRWLVNQAEDELVPPACRLTPTTSQELKAGMGEALAAAITTAVARLTPSNSSQDLLLCGGNSNRNLDRRSQDPTRMGEALAAAVARLPPSRSSQELRRSQEIITKAGVGEALAAAMVSLTSPATAAALRMTPATGEELRGSLVGV